MARGRVKQNLQDLKSPDPRMVCDGIAVRAVEDQQDGLLTTYCVRGEVVRNLSAIESGDGVVNKRSVFCRRAVGSKRRQRD